MVVPPVPEIGEFPIDFRQSVKDFEIGLIKMPLPAASLTRKNCRCTCVTYHQLRGYLKKYDLLDNQIYIPHTQDRGQPPWNPDP